MHKWEYARGYFIGTRNTQINVEYMINQELGSQSFASLEEMFQDMGEHGWELVSISTFIGTTGPYPGITATQGEVFYFKRPKEA